MQQETQQDILCEEFDAVGVITLNRPQALNALNLTMIRQMDQTLQDWQDNDKIQAVIVKGAGERAFCSGGDVKAVALDGMAARQGKSDGALTRDFFREEYILNHRIFHFSKPYISLIDGIVMGGGKGISAHGSHRVVTENTLFAMPETSIGFFPDVGGGYFLPRCPGQTGTYLAMTSHRIEAADTLYIGFGTHYIPRKGIAPLVENLLTADWKRADSMTIANGILANFNSEPDHDAILPAIRQDIDRCFACDRVEDIFAALSREETGWARETTAAMEKMSPTSLKLTLAQLRCGEKMNDFGDIMQMEYRLSQACMQGHDFYEGIRAALIDKDRAPQWDPARVEDVSDDMIEACFASLGENDLVF